MRYQQRSHKNWVASCPSNCKTTLNAVIHRQIIFVAVIFLPLFAGGCLGEGGGRENASQEPPSQQAGQQAAPSAEAGSTPQPAASIAPTSNPQTEPDSGLEPVVSEEPPPQGPVQPPQKETACLAPGESADPNGQYTSPVFQQASMPSHTGAMMEEHMAALALVDYTEVTHAAIVDGDWCNPEVWHNKTIPGENARVVISADVSVRYNLHSDVDLKTLRVDGALYFSTEKNTRLKFDTLYVESRGTLQIGTLSAPLPQEISAELIVTANGNIDVAWDPMLLSRGIIAHGVTQIHGAEKTAHSKVESDPSKGDSLLLLAGAPVNWQVGDTLIVAGSRYSGWKWDNAVSDTRYHGTQDEVRSITHINGNQITLNKSLSYDHRSPREDLKISVANMSRNVTIASEHGPDLPAHQRGHVMFMHSPQVDVRYAAFNELGRTDKSVESFNVQDVTEVKPDSNVRGRYSFHFHRTGVNDQRRPAIAVGNAVYRSPGWGYVHHDSHGELVANVSFDTFGAGFVAESGNETGEWRNNLAIRAEGNCAFNPKNGNDVQTFDTGRTGDGFWFQGRMVRSFDNIAASVNHGFVYFHRGADMFEFSPELFMLPEALGLGQLANADDVPILGFDGNEAFASTVGLFILKANTKQQHDVSTVLKNFTAWEVRAGAAIEYTAHYLLRDFDLIGNTEESFRAPLFGIDFGNNTSDMIVHDARIQGFHEGIVLGKFHTNTADNGKDQFVVIGGEYHQVDEPLVEYDAAADLQLSSDQLQPQRFEIALNNSAPMQYLDPATTASAGLRLTGEKTDSIGNSPLPAGVDEITIPYYDMIAILERDGYFQAANGDAYAVVEQYFSDRASGEIYKKGLKTRLGPDVLAVMQNSNGAWGNAVFAGEINLDSSPPVAANDSASTFEEVEVILDLLANDTDEEGDTLQVDGIVQPRNGRVYPNDDGTFTYRPAISFRGSDQFYYWVTDGQGNYAKGRVKLEVVAP